MSKTRLNRTWLLQFTAADAARHQKAWQKQVTAQTERNVHSKNAGAQQEQQVATCHNPSRFSPRFHSTLTHLVSFVVASSFKTAIPPAE